MEDGRGKHPNSIKNRFQEGQSGNPAGRKKGSRNKKTILKKLLNIKLDKDNEAINRIKAFLPEIFENVDEPTIEEVIFARMILEAIFSSKPISYMREIFDRAYGRPTFENVDDDPESQNAEWDKRMEILQEQLVIAREESNKKAIE